MSSDSIVTDYAQFYRATSNGVERYYPVSNQSMREAAIEFDESGDPVIVGGFGVYDTAKSTVYAVALYASKDDAEGHKAVDTAATKKPSFSGKINKSPGKRSR